jgi:hypothetical protein
VALGAVLRIAIAAGALALALVSWSRLSETTAREHQLAEFLERAHISIPKEFPYEPDGGRLELRASRAILSAALDPARTEIYGPQRSIANDRAVLARGILLAESALRSRPTIWEAAMALGGTLYVDRSRAHDLSVLSDARAWEEPLHLAIDLSPGRVDAARFLAGAYLETWPYLTGEKRDEERQLLARLFREDAGSLNGLIRPWLEVAANRDEAFEVMPADPDAWSLLERIYADRSDWDGFCAARHRWDTALRERLATRVSTAERLVATDPVAARSLFLGVIADIPPDRRYLDLLVRSLETCPSGTIDRQTAARFTRIFDWSTEQCRIAGCPLPSPALARLATFCRDLSPQLDAVAALMTGDTNRAEVLSRTYATTRSDDWAPFRLLQAKILATQRRDPQSSAEANEGLASLPLSWRNRPSYWQTRSLLAKTAGDVAGEAAATRELRKMAARSWTADAWDPSAGAWKLELMSDTSAAGLTVAVREAPPRGAAVEVRLDQTVLGMAPMRAGAQISFPAAITPGIHLLEFETVGGAAAAPGAVRLEPAPEKGRQPAPY